MTNLADLLPAGGGQNNTDFVADGAIVLVRLSFSRRRGRLRLLLVQQQ